MQNLWATELLGISQTLNNKLERANHYALTSIFNLGN